MDERGISSTPKSLLTESSRLSEANTTSDSSCNVSERRASKITTVATATRDLGAVNGGSQTNGNRPSESHVCSAPTDIAVLASVTDAPAMASKTSNVIFMRPRYSRRVQSKSEPCRASPEPSSAKLDESPAKRTDDVKAAVCINNCLVHDCRTRLTYFIEATPCVGSHSPEQPNLVFDSQTQHQGLTRREAAPHSATQFERRQMRYISEPSAQRDVGATAREDFCGHQGRKGHDQRTGPRCQNRKSAATKDGRESVNHYGSKPGHSKHPTPANGISPRTSRPHSSKSIITQEQPGIRNRGGQDKRTQKVLRCFGSRSIILVCIDIIICSIV